MLYISFSYYLDLDVRHFWVPYNLRLLLLAVVPSIQLLSLTSVLFTDYSLQSIDHLVLFYFFFLHSIKISRILLILLVIIMYVYIAKYQGCFLFSSVYSRIEVNWFSMEK